MTKPLSKTQLKQLAPASPSTTTESQREYRRRFCAALRSGRYRQTRRTFARIESGRWFWSSPIYTYCALGVAQAAGITISPNHIECLMGTKDRGSIMALNDTNGWSFEQIADWVEAQP